MAHSLIVVYLVPSEHKLYNVVYSCLRLSNDTTSEIYVNWHFLYKYIINTRCWFLLSLR